MVVALVGFQLTTSCFTGVESTPKITLGDVAREKAATLTDEQAFFQMIVPLPIAQWQPGKSFFVIDDKAGIVFSKAGGGYSGLKRGDLVEFIKTEESTSITGAKNRLLYFTDPAGETVLYRMKDNEGNGSVPFIVDLDVVGQARQLLKGKHLWTMTPIWRDSLDNVKSGIKFVEVAVKDVKPGTATYPLRVDFETVDVEPLESGSLMINPVGLGAGSRTFEGQFSLTDPHLRYQSIQPETWELIKHGQVARGMTRDECRLSIGSPKDLDRRAGYSDVREIWMYENGIYLIFSDGLLIDYRR